MVGHDIVVVGASAGGVEALDQLIRALPQNLPAAIFVVLHVSPHSKSLLPDILNRSIKRQHQNSSHLRALHPENGEKIEHGRIYIAPPNQHLLVKKGYITLAPGPRENSHRPAVDPLFRTAARAYGSRVVGVILSGTLDDGTAGLSAIKQQGGVAIAQDPEEALYVGMPRSAIENVAVDHIERVQNIAKLLVELAHQPIVRETQAVANDLEIEADMAELQLDAMQLAERPGTPSPFGCPDCGGVLWELNDGKMTRFRCRTGHAYSTNSLFAEQSEALEEALWNALRTLEEKAALSQRMAQRARDRNQPYSAKRFEIQWQDAQAQTTLIRQLLLKERPQMTDAIALPVNAENGLQPNVASSERSPMYVVAICASAGGLKALSEVLSSISADFPAAIVVVQHLYPHQPSLLANILSRCTPLSVKEAEQGDVLQPGKVYIAPPNKHLLVTLNHTLSLSDAALVHFLRPSGDLLFESVAASCQQHAIAVVLTGTGSDGAIGVQAIKQVKGTAIAQDCTDAEFLGMPQAAIDTGKVDWIVPLNEIAATLTRLVAPANQLL